MSRLILAFFALLIIGSFGASSGSRLKSRVLEYQHPQNAESQHRTVQRIILNTINYIRDNLATASSSLDYLADVGTYADGGTPILSPGELPGIWNDTQFPALQVLYGRIEPEAAPGSALVVRSEIFIGDLPAKTNATLQKNTFAVTSNTALSQYGRLADGHAYVLVYALILDAIYTEKTDDVILALIHASSVIHDKLKRKGLLSDELNRIHQSILAIEETK